MATAKLAESTLTTVFFSNISAAPFVLEGAAGEEDEAVDDGVEDGVEVELELELDPEFVEMTPPCTVGGAELLVVFAAPET